MPLARGPKLWAMPSFGERLRQEREARNTTIEEIGAATGIEPGYLDALEKNEFHALPGRAFGKLYIRAYAEVLGFDPQPLIDDYDRERHQKRRAPTEPPRPEPGRRPVEAAIADWRESKLAERNRRERAVATVEAEQEGPSDVPCDEPADARDHEPGETGEDNPVEAPQVEAAAAVPVAEASARQSRMRWANNRSVVILLLCMGLFLGAVGIYSFFFEPGEERGPSSVPTIAQESPGSEPPQVEPPPEPRSLGVAEPPAAPSPAKPVAGPTTGPGRLTVPEFGVGRRIVKRRLEGQDERFAEWDVVWFSTRVLGGKPGEPIRHVWLHEGRVQQSIELGLGGPDWRTQSSKTLGKTGQWAVEARDREGGVLARATFTCVPAGP